jgi:hypothetical protein
MSISETALSVAKAMRYNQAMQAQIRAEYGRLAQEIATGSDGASEITSATVNGQSFGKTVTMTKGDKLKMIERALWHVDHNRFSNPNRTFYSGGYQS